MNTSNLNIRTNRPAFRVKLGKEMSINKKVLHLLDNPKNIHFWWNKSEKVLLIGKASQATPLSFEIKDRCYETKTGFKIEKRKFIQTILKIADWRCNMIYVVIGEYIAELKMVAFHLNDAMESKVEMD